MDVSFIDDEFTRDKCKWFVELEDHSKIYQDDRRPEINNPIAWIRLKEYIKNTGKRIIGVYIQFWDHIEKVMGEADGYYFIQSVGAFASGESSFSYFLFGEYKEGDEEITITRWMVPEILEVGKEQRKISTDEDSLLINGKK